MYNFQTSSKMVGKTFSHQLQNERSTTLVQYFENHKSHKELFNLFFFGFSYAVAMCSETMQQKMLSVFTSLKPETLATFSDCKYRLRFFKNFLV